VAEEGQVIEALAAIGSIGTVGLAAALVVLAFKALHAKDELVTCLALLRDEQKLAAEYKSQRDISVVNEGVTASKLLQETTLRKSVESDLEDAQAQLNTYLARTLAGKDQSQIDEATAYVFRRRHPSPGVPLAETKAAPDRTGPDGLINPFDS
jgi:hypothetical protein